MDPGIEIEKRKIQKQYLDLQARENARIRERNNSINKLQNEMEVILGDKAEDDYKRTEMIRLTANLQQLQENRSLVSQSKYTSIRQKNQFNSSIQFNLF